MGSLHLKTIIIHQIYLWQINNVCLLRSCCCVNIIKQRRLSSSRVIYQLISLWLDCFYHGHRMTSLAIFLTLVAINWNLGSSHPNPLSVDTCCETYINDWDWCQHLDQMCNIQYLCVPEFKSCYGKQNVTSTQVNLCFLKKKPSCCLQASFDRLERLYNSCQGPLICRDQSLDPCREEIWYQRAKRDWTFFI